MAGQHWIGRECVSDLVQALRSYGDAARPPGRASASPRASWRSPPPWSAGLSNKEIAKKFVLSEDTVKHHLTNIFDKVGASNRLELALFAIHHRLLEERDSVRGR